METGKTGKYLKYAIGEIILVVIGILIALQINNWNEKRKAKVNESALYSRMIMDLKIDENRITTHIDYYNRDLEILNTIYQESQGLSKKDSIIDYSSIRAGRIFDLIITANYSKNTKEISRPQIGERFNQYFTLEHHVNDAFELIWNFKEDHLKPYLAKYGINDTKALFNNRQLNYYSLREKNIFSYSKLKEQYGTVELDQMLFDLGVRTSWAKTALESLLPENQKLQEDLTNELDGNTTYNE
jgi:hypothetical protein